MVRVLIAVARMTVYSALAVTAGYPWLVAGSGRVLPVSDVWIGGVLSVGCVMALASMLWWDGWWSGYDARDERERR